MFRAEPSIPITVERPAIATSTLASISVSINPTRRALLALGNLYAIGCQLRSGHPDQSDLIALRIGYDRPHLRGGSEHSHA